MYEKTDLELVKTLITKTKEKKIKWEKGYSDWNFKISLVDGTEITIDKSLNDTTNRWNYIVSMSKKNNILSEASFSEPYLRTFPPVFKVDSSYQKIESDYKLVDSLFQIVKQEVDNDIFNMKNATLEALKSM